MLSQNKPSTNTVVKREKEEGQEENLPEEVKALVGKGRALSYCEASVKGVKEGRRLG